MSNEYLQHQSQLALQVLPEAIILLDSNLVIQFVNAAAIRLFEISDVATHLGTSFSTFPGGSGLMTYSQRVAYHNHVNEVAIHTVPSPQPNDEQQWSAGVNNHNYYFRAVPMRDEQGQDRGFIISIVDWTGEHKASELLSALLSDLLTPFHTIRGFSEMLLKENPSHPLTDEQRKWVTIIYDKAGKLLEFREAIINERKKHGAGNKWSTMR
jgi:nitrogen-specific signal transduction histidine kinase